jgi:hypothetical protein
MEILPSFRDSLLPAAILHAVEIIFRVTKRAGRKGDSWLKRIPVQADKPYASL